MSKLLAIFLIFFCSILNAAVTIDLYGDSTQAGAELVNGAYVTTPNPPAKILQDRMNVRFGMGAVIVRNKGVGGSSIANQYFGQSPYFTRNWLAEMTASDANIVIVNHGINDSFISYMKPVDYIWVVNQMSAEAQSRGKKFYIETPNPINNPANVKLASFVSALYTSPLYTNTNIININGQLLNNWGYWIKQLPDGIHPNADMYKFNGDLLFYALEPTVKSMLGL